MKDWKNYITSDPAVMAGKPVIRDTRIPVDLILEKLAEGESINQILESYPRLTKDAVMACLSYAANSIKNEITYPVAL